MVDHLAPIQGPDHCRAHGQQTTGDQFFGESQFESYRRLGLHITEQCLNAHSRLLPSVPASTFVHGTIEPTEEPTWATHWVRFITGWRLKGEKLPERGGSLVDHCVVAALFSLALLLLIAIVGACQPPAVPALCGSVASCREAVATLLGIWPAALPRVFDFRYVTLTLDNFLVIAYLATFVMTFVIATRGLRRRLRFWVMGGLCLLAVVTAGADYLENFSLFANVAKPSSANGVREHIANISLVKSVLAGLCLAIVLPMQYFVVQALRARWKR